MERFSEISENTIDPQENKEIWSKVYNVSLKFNGKPWHPKHKGFVDHKRSHKPSGHRRFHS